MSLINYATNLSTYNNLTLNDAVLFQECTPYGLVQNLDSSLSIKPKTPATVVGELILRPLIDRTVQAFSTLWRCAQAIDSIFNRAVTLPGVAASDLSTTDISGSCIPLEKVEERVLEKYDEMRRSGKALKRQVQETLCNGGKIVRQTSLGQRTSGAYLIQDQNGKTIAIFKPEDEGTWRPHNPNPQYRKAEISEEDKYFHQVNSAEQGKPAIRQHLAELLHVGTATTIPRGIIMDLSSDQFFSLAAQSKDKRNLPQTKRGFLQQWISNSQPLINYHPTMKGCSSKQLPPITALNFHDNPILDRISLDDFQEVVLNDMLIYNQDRNTGNLLVSFDAENNLYLTLIDHDAVLPGKLTSLFGMYQHTRMNEPFTITSLQLIQAIDPDFQAVAIEKAGLSKEIANNAKALAIVIKYFAATGATLHDIERFVSFGDRDQQAKTSKLWKMMEETKEEAIRQLPEKDREMFQHNAYLRRADWCETIEATWCERLPRNQHAEAALWQKEYRKKHAQRIEKQVQENFWTAFECSLTAITQRHRQEF